MKLEYRWAPKTIVESNRILAKGNRALRLRGFREVSSEYDFTDGRNYNKNAFFIIGF